VFVLAAKVLKKCEKTNLFFIFYKIMVIISFFFVPLQFKEENE